MLTEVTSWYPIDYFSSVCGRWGGCGKSLKGDEQAAQSQAKVTGKLKSGECEILRMVYESLVQLSLIEQASR